MAESKQQIIDALISGGTIRIEQSTLIDMKAGTARDANLVYVRTASRKTVARLAPSDNTSASEQIAAIAAMLAEVGY